jgi:hypothetical protein
METCSRDLASFQKCSRTLRRSWGLILWNSLSGEFISIPKDAIGMATTCEDKPRALPKIIRSGV